MWRLDNSIWDIQRSLKITRAPGIDPNHYVYHQVTGSVSMARTGIESVTSTYDTSGVLVFELFYARSIGSFQDGDEVIDATTGAMG